MSELREKAIKLIELLNFVIDYDIEFINDEISEVWISGLIKEIEILNNKINKKVS